MSLVHSSADGAFIPTDRGERSASEVLSAAADLLDKPGVWIQRSLAKDADGVSYRDKLPKKPVCFCAEGAIQWAAKGSRTAEKGAFDALRAVLPTDFVYEWNDAPGRTKSEVVAAFRKAAEGKPQE